VAVGTKLDRGSTVVVALSKGPDLISVPSLANMTVDQVKAALTSIGFVVGSVTGNTDTGALFVYTKGVPVKLGDQYPRGTVFDLVYQ
jgi:beta-lactam-binding protein with PASTA domain